ncbi:uncharacterized protein LOC126870371 isoform X1 [Bombus huntii]|uniref:uncharacterized protein LOC126870371 isoform X1 n=1 Tax=Bombus huntii TaxID=85661 RepID=UPI0021A9BC14|nr:uncharacterized protein LOC126870371 isoform X1 [Bombus huntii]XP_050483979.1 uncharacterized protein LOC126870371 isoform X1 [Bombus huntii]XP_050483980.1 uncharacterized protein LOC126870371 isoform X1 [Bombus huntii]
MFGKFVTKLIQSLPTWEVTKYYGRVCIYQLKCLKYRVQTSEAWFNFKCKFMPGSLHKEIECEDYVEPKVNNKSKQQKEQPKVSSERESQDKVQYNAKDHKSVPTSLKELKDNYIIDELIDSKKKKQGKKRCQENNKYPIHEDYVTKKERKVQFNYNLYY